jgi:hypothetical protein
MDNTNNNNSIGEYRVRLVDYFASVTNEIDVFIETRLPAFFNDEVKSAELNKMRDIMLKKVREIESLNLEHLNKNLANKLETLAADISKLFVSFCFVVDTYQEIKLIVTEEYIPARVLTLYKELIKHRSGELCIYRDEGLIKQLFDFESINEQVNK